MIKVMSLTAWRARNSKGLVNTQETLQNVPEYVVDVDMSTHKRTIH